MSVLRAGAAGAPLTTVLGVYNRTFFNLVARPEIKSLGDLRGKPVGISRYGASTEYAVRFALRANGIDPDKTSSCSPWAAARTARASRRCKAGLSPPLYCKSRRI